eukprot:4276878-Pleurochrysis_carterae.AAC.1
MAITMQLRPAATCKSTYASSRRSVRARSGGYEEQGTGRESVRCAHAEKPHSLGMPCLRSMNGLSTF